MAKVIAQNPPRTALRTPMQTKIHRCSNPLYKWCRIFCPTYLPTYFESSLEYLLPKTMMQCKCKANAVILYCSGDNDKKKNLYMFSTDAVCFEFFQFLKDFFTLIIHCINSNRMYEVQHGISVYVCNV